MKQIFSHTYKELGNSFSVSSEVADFPNNQLVIYNKKLALELGLDLEKYSHEELGDILSGQKLLDNSEPIAQVYAGHQFGYFNPQLGDGRAVLLGELEDVDGEIKDIVLKGSGGTVFSRGGDGKAPLSAVIREYLLSEAMYALGIPTTRALGIVSTGELLYRESIVPGGILTRVASSHIRIGTFEYFYSKGDTASLKKLLDYSINRHYPELKRSKNIYSDFFHRVVQKQCDLVIEFYRVGFIHGVMNTDNILICGETIDYGPCAFMDSYNFMQKFSSIDEQGRYAFGNQKDIILWNLEQFGNTLGEYISEDMRTKVLEKAAIDFSTKYYAMMNAKLGISEKFGSKKLVDELLKYMQQGSIDFTHAFYYLGNGGTGLNEFINLFSSTDESLEINILSWVKAYKKILEKQGIEENIVRKNMNALNPVIIPRNHLVQRAIIEATQNNNWKVFNTFHNALKNPYDIIHKDGEYFAGPEKGEELRETFCGT